MERRIGKKKAAEIRIGGFLCILLVLTTCLVPAITDAQFISYQEIGPGMGGFTGLIEDGDRFGESVAALGDLDGDSIPDIAISAEGDDDGGSNRGAVWILFLNSNGTVKVHQKISATQGGFTGVLINGSQFGDKIASIGDLDGNGTIDLAVGAQGDNDGGRGWGAVWILFLNSNGTVKAYQKISATQGGFGASEPISSKVAGIGDFNLDGVPDIAVGSQSIDDGGPNRGAVWIICLNKNGTVKSKYKISNTVGGFTGQLDDNDEFGHDVAGLGDFDGDGVVDIAVNAQGDDDGGVDAAAIWILFLNSNGTVKDYQKISATQGGFTDPLRSYDALGEAMAALGDLNGDGVTDFAVGADYHDDPGRDNGAAWILYLNPDATVAYYEKISGSTPGLGGVLFSGYEFGNDAACIGDLNGDDVVDLVVTSNTSYVGTGSAIVFLLDPLVAPPAGGTGVYLQANDDGIVSIEAEHANVNLPQGGHVWVPVFSAGYSGTGAMQAQPNSGINNDTGYVTNSPRLDYEVNFVHTGIHYVWIRGLAAGGSDDSVHVGLDGVGLSTSDRITAFNPTWTWSKATIDGVVATVNVATTGVHTVNVWMREDGFVFDKVVLTVRSSYIPTGTGPAESPRTDANALVFSPDALTFTVAEGGTTSSQITDLDTNDGSASYTLSDDADWLTVSPTSGDTPDALTASIDATGLTPGTYTAIITATASGYTDDTVNVTLTVTGDSGAGGYQQDSGADGIVSIEVENSDVNLSQGGHTWVPVFPAGYSGTGAMQAQPNSGTNNNTGYVTNSPRLDYEVNFVHTGTHYVWIRGLGANDEDDSVHVGLDGVALSTSDRITVFNPTWTWSKATIDGVVATVNVATTGVHTVNVWMREDGFVIDKVVLTVRSSYTPTGTGPAESPRTDANALVFSPDALTFTVEEGGTTSSQITDLDTSDGSASYTLSDDADWLTVSPTSGDTPDALTASIDATGLTPGTYTATITATASGYTDDTVDVTLTVTAVPELVFAPDVLSFTVEENGTTPSQSTDLGTTDGSVSYAISDDADWLDVSPTSGDTPDTLTVSIAAAGLTPGTYTATITATASGYTDDTVNVTLTVTGESGAYEQDGGADGIVSIEAENSDVNLSQGGHTWVPVSPAGYSGTGAMQAQPNSGTNNNTGYVTNSPRLDYEVNFVHTGTHYVWIRGLGANDEDDSVHVGLDGVALSTSDRITNFNPTWTWSKATMDGVVATVNVATTGVHTVNVWMREDGFVIDKLVLTISASYIPTGTGPAESPRTDANALVFSPDALTFTVEEGGTTSSQITDLDTSDGSASYTLSDDADWLTVSPTSGDTPDALTASIDATGLTPGTYTAIITATASGYTDDTVNVTLTVTGDSGAGGYQQDSGADGIVSIEAENSDVNLSQGGHDWVPVSPADYSGTGAMQAQPNLETNNNTGYVTISPRLDYQVDFVYTGIHYVWIRGLGANDDNDSVHVGLDGAGLSTSDRINNFNSTWTWSKATMDGVVATVNVATTGVHTVNVWMREDGFVIDKIVLTVSSAYTPTGTGPAESPRTDANALVFSPDALTFTVEEGGTTSSQITDLDTSDGSASYTLSDDADWLTVSPTSGDTPDALTASIDATGLTPGTYTAIITATASGYTDDTVNVTLTVTALSAPELFFTPDALTFTVEEGETTSSQTTVLGTTDGSVSYAISDDADWLDVSPTSGDTPDTLTVSIAAAGLTPGTYTATITATASGYTDDTVDVTLTVTGG